VTAHTAALAEKIFAIAEGPTHVVADQHHVAAWQVWQPASIFPGEERPEPVLVGAMSFFNTRGCAAVALMAGEQPNLSGS